MKMLIFGGMLGLSLCACQAQTPSEKPTQNQQEPSVNKTSAQTAAPAPAQSLRLFAGGRHFEITLENNPTTAAFAGLLPLDLTMSDHLNNEKYAALPKSLPANDQTAGQIRAGEVMLYQGDTLVVFYESFNSSYRYTKIGVITDTKDLKTALGKGSVAVKIGR